MIALIILLGVVVLGGGSCVMCLCIGAKGVVDQQAQIAQQKRNATSVRISDLLAAYKGNEISSDSQYKGRWLRITGGQVDNIKKDVLDNAFITVGTGKLFEIPEVQCMLSSSDRASSLRKGDHVSVVGRVDGLMFNVIVRDCEVQ